MPIPRALLLSNIQKPDITRFLIPATALAAAARRDKGSSVQFECPAIADPNKPVLKLTVACGKIPPNPTETSGNASRAKL
ncbi:MAG: hypothetical protein WCP35_17475 [Verrucomicrobiota bacterium]